MGVLVISGTGTDVGKTVVAAAIAALAVADGQRVAMLKPAQSGVAMAEPGDVDEVTRLAGELTTQELRRYPDPLAPDVAARRADLPPVRPADAAAAVTALNRTHDLVLVEGTGGLLVRMDDAGGTLADVAWALNSAVLLVVPPFLGTLNTTALTAEALSRRGVELAGVVIGRWPDEPDLASRCNLIDLPRYAGAPLLGVLPDALSRLDSGRFLMAARAGLSPLFGGAFDPDEFVAAHGPRGINESRSRHPVS